MQRSVRLIVLFLMVVAFALPFPETFSAFETSAYAQQIKRAKKRKRSFLERLFGGNQAKSKRVTRRKKTRRKSRRKSRRRSTARASRTIVPAVEKLETAKTVLVVGDFFAGGLAKGLVEAYAKSPNVRIVGESSGSSGLVREDYFNWPVKVAEYIDKHNPVAVVVMLGTNDRQTLRTGGKKLKHRTEQWDAAYAQRIEILAKTVREKQRALLWMGLPPVRLSKMNSDFLVFNEMYRTKAEKVNGKFIDIWDGFTNAEGNYVRSGPNINGQIVRLRSGDGINVNKAGRRKLAFYAEKELSKIVDGSIQQLASLPVDSELPSTPAQPEYNPRKTGVTRVIPLDKPAQEDTQGLAGATKRKKLVLKGEPKSDIAGRVDNYQWPPSESQSPVANAEVR
ncbi:MAG: SGNH family hydrolase [Pseudomonadota bacterium]